MFALAVSGWLLAGCAGATEGTSDTTTGDGSTPLEESVQTGNEEEVGATDDFQFEIDESAFTPVEALVNTDSATPGTEVPLEVGAASVSDDGIVTTVVGFERGPSPETFGSADALYFPMEEGHERLTIDVSISNTSEQTIEMAGDFYRLVVPGEAIERSVPADIETLSEVYQLPLTTLEPGETMTGKLLFNNVPIAVGDPRLDLPSSRG